MLITTNFRRKGEGVGGGGGGENRTILVKQASITEEKRREYNRI